MNENMKTVRKKCSDRDKAKQEMYTFRQNGFDAFCVGAMLVVQIDSWVSGIWEKFQLFGAGWEMVS